MVQSDVGVVEVSSRVVHEIREKLQIIVAAGWDTPAGPVISQAAVEISAMLPTRYEFRPGS